MATLREHWTKNQMTVVFENDEVVFIQNGAEYSRMPARFFPLKETDIDREVTFVTVDLEDGTAPFQMPKLV